MATGTRSKVASMSSSDPLSIYLILTTHWNRTTVVIPRMIVRVHLFKKIQSTSILPIFQVNIPLIFFKQVVVSFILFLGQSGALK